MNLVQSPSPPVTQEKKFFLAGVRYYQQGRKCGKAGCRCQAGEMHGPYWYRNGDGRRKYIGRELPSDVASARAAWHEQRGNVDTDIRELESRLRCLRRLQRNEALTAVDKIMLRQLGYGDCLV